METLVEKISSELEQLSDEKTRLSSRRFFKEEIKLHGVKTPAAQTIGREHFRSLKNLSKDQIFGLCEALFQTGYFEEAIIACNWSYAMRKHFKPCDFLIFKRWIDEYITNWATCDTFCNHTMGSFIEMYPSFTHHLKQFAKSDNRWMRRAAAVSLIVPGRKGLFLQDILDIADLLLVDTDDMVRKGYGWMLKVAAEKHQQVILNFVVARKKEMPRTSLRYAIEKMPAELKEIAMKR
jgi:3-methyladenine DNA glycosylase AlkD